MSTKAIERFLQTAYTDEKLAALLAWAEDGGLSALSCCCLIGISTRVGSFNKAFEFSPAHGGTNRRSHYLIARSLEGAVEAELEFMGLGDDGRRRARIIPLIHAEMEHRAALRAVETEGVLVAV